MDFPKPQPPQGLNYSNVGKVRVRRLSEMLIHSALEPKDKEPQENEQATNPIKVKACEVRVRRLSQLQIDAANKFQANLRAILLANSPATRAGGNKGRGGPKKKNRSLSKKHKCNCVIKRKRVPWPGKRPLGLSISMSQLKMYAANKFQANLRAILLANSPATRAGGNKGRGGPKKKNRSLSKKHKCNGVTKRKRVTWPGMRPFGLSKK